MMLPPFPFFRFPMSYNSYRNPYYNNFQHNTVNSTVSSVSPNNHYKDYDDKISKKDGQTFGRVNFASQNFHASPSIQSDVSNSTEAGNVVSDSRKSSSGEFFDIFGIRLYFDDILILCLLFFLYQEEVQDQFLFIALLLLLLS